MGRNALKSTARGWQSIPQTQTPGSERFKTRPSKQQCQCDYVFVSALVVYLSLGVVSYLIFPIRGDYFQAQPTWNPVLQVLPRYPLLQTWPTDLGIVAPRALFVTVSLVTLLDYWTFVADLACRQF
ncbi:hypothetical protein EDD17DRAFT_1568285 [Pisolithus thermaeus]|nr:hypothetical protein EDD17DRAFT_1568285 [Pisolithus thermaeus]